MAQETKRTDQWSRPWPNRAQHRERMRTDLLDGKTWLVWDDATVAGTITLDTEEPRAAGGKPVWPTHNRHGLAVYVGASSSGGATHTSASAPHSWTGPPRRQRGSTEPRASALTCGPPIAPFTRTTNSWVSPVARRLTRGTASTILPRPCSSGRSSRPERGTRSYSPKRRIAIVEDGGLALGLAADRVVQADPGAAGRPARFCTWLADAKAIASTNAEDRRRLRRRAA
jgi:hypothetical protein